ncbi:hypothetical protein EGW08_005827 [Elysia chlorotica]|uniref:Uncharacterized protein n=1 Tax=Elysia chlorotica TaxID=188477 RepID=A0A3S1BQN2_ELYCH|nr:hypothetical protein EGW08_005827 [Elysia chlorotica]
MLNMKSPGVLAIVFLCICVSHSFGFARYNNRRPRTRLFGTSSALASPVRYNSEPRRASVRPFRIPGFERSQASITSSRASRMGFDLGLGGRALSDPIASMYDSVGGGAGSRLSFINDVGFDSLGGAGDLYASSLGFNDGFITAASNRDLKRMDFNSAGSRLRQPMDIGNYGNQMISSSSLGGRGVLSNQDQLRNYDLNYDSSGLGGGGVGSGSQFLLSGAGSQAGQDLSQASLESQAGQRLGSAGGTGQLGLGTNSWLGIDTNDFSSGGLGLASNQFNGLGSSGSGNMGLSSNVDQFGMSGGFGSQMSLGNSQLGSSFNGNQLDLSGNQLGLGSLGPSQGQMSSSLDVAGNQLGGMVSGQQGYLVQGQSDTGLASVGSNGNILSSQLGQNQLGMVGMNEDGQLSSMSLQSGLGVMQSSMGNQISSNGFNGNLGVVGSSLSGGTAFSPGDVVLI